MKAAANAARYEVQLTLDTPPDDAAPVFNTTLLTYTPTPLLTLRTYFWRVRAANSAGILSAWSETRQFTVITAANGAPNRNYYTTLRPTLTWARISWAMSYEVEIPNTSAFLSPIGGILAPDTFSYTPNEDLAEGTWYWRVRALKSVTPFSPGSWSVVQQFVVELP